MNEVVEKINFLIVDNKDLIIAIESLAKEIWEEHYIAIVGKPQVDYMLAKYQSKNAIFEQIKEGCKYYLISNNNCNIGYIGICLKDSHLFLSKIYVKSEFRGMGYGKMAISFIEQLTKENGLNSIKLSVNKNNVNSITAYKKQGFKIIDARVINIGNGFVMDDYEMEKIL